MRLTLGSSQAGMRKPSKLQISPEAVAKIKGLRTSSRQKLLCAWRAMGHTAAILNIGTQTPISTEISSRPSGPAKRSASASAMKELKRKPTCAAAAWSLRSMKRPMMGQ